MVVQEGDTIKVTTKTGGTRTSDKVLAGLEATEKKNQEEKSIKNASFEERARRKERVTEKAIEKRTEQLLRR